MRSLVKMTLVLGLLSVCLPACDKEKQAPSNEGSAINNREVGIEISGNYSGTFDVGYVGETGSTQAATGQTQLPWTRNIVYQASVTHTSAQVTGFGGLAGQTMTLKVTIGGTIVRNETAIAQSDGSIAIAPLAYAF